MKNSWAIILLLSAGQVVYGQYSNDWIDYNQSYYKIMTGQDGVYRITYDDLVQAGLPVSTIDPRKLQIFHRGEELSIKVAGQQDARLDPGDYLEFYGQRNDGTVDRALYQPNAAQPHGYYNLFSDSTACFLTWKLNTETGKRIANYKENNVASLPAQTANNQEIIQLNTSRYARGRNLANRVYLTRFDYGEGWTGDLFQENQSVDYVLTGIVNAVQPAGIPKLEIQIMGESTIGHQAEIYAGPNAASLSLVQTITFNAFAAQTISLDLSWPMINAAGELTVRVKALGINGGNDLLSVPYLKLNYPRTFDLTGQSGYLSLFPDAADKSYIEVNNPPVGAVIWDITMPNHPIETGYNLIDPVMNAVVRNTAAGRQLFVFNNTITPVLKKVNMRLLDPLTADYLIITHKNLMQPTGSYTDPVRAYAAYRASAVGGTYDTLVVDIDQLYNQFSYGEITPLAIFRFVEYMQQGNPRYMFLIGKGLDVRHNYHRNPAAFTYHDLVPTAGYPGSDNAFTAGLDQFNFTPAFAVGRITASAPDEVGAYLEKVKEMEATPFNALWRKNLLHLSGGITPDEQSVFFTYMEGFRKIAEDIYLGGKVKTIRKNTTETVTQINISDEINSGLNFVTFLGHSNPNVIDIDVGFASDPINGYNNKGKYPMLLINGCEAGLIYNNNRLFGEDWILTPEKGAVGFMAHSSYGAAYFLRGYTDMLYQNAFGDSVLRNKTIGEVRMQTIRDYLALFGTINMWHPAQVQQLIYLGDPALKTFGAGTPDYQTQNSALTVRPFDQQMVTAQTDSFALDIIVKNYGTATRDSLKIRVERIISDGRILTYDTVFAPVFYQDTLSFVLHNDFFNPMNGDNTFRVFIDPLYEVAEIDEMNNMAEIRYFIPLNGTRNLIPADYAIVPGTSVNLLAQTTDLFSPLKSVVFELDTAFTFDSPFKKTLTAMGTVLSSTVVTLLPVDSTIYYW
ncbi:MAG: C25 family cysteine peptidase, partial [Cyclobacteriaceae bacterium]|nr:C25 family cysteine peptidase [Cyclobacteriaceae bacterium]